MTEYFLIAKIISAEGDKGLLKINSFSDDLERFSKLKKVFIDFWGEKKIFSVQSIVTRNENIFIKFKNFEDKQSVDVLIGKEIFVDIENLRELPKGHYFIHDIIGSKVIRGGDAFGEVTDVYSLPANDVYVIRKINGEEILIPAVNEFIESIDPTKKILIIKPGKELYEEDEN